MDDFERQVTWITGIIIGVLFTLAWVIGHYIGRELGGFVIFLIVWIGIPVMMIFGDDKKEKKHDKKD